MILLLGSTGYVGEAFARFFKHSRIAFTTFSVRTLDDMDNLRDVLLREKITYMFNCAGVTGKPNVDACEQIKDQTLLANSLLPAHLALTCAKYGVKFIHISSGCIYDDSKCSNGHKPIKEFTEIDSPNFCFDSMRYSWYSATKALREELISSRVDRANYLCLRMRIPFNGEHNERNFISKLLSYPVLLNATNSFSNLDEFVLNAFLLRNQIGVINLTQPGYITTKQIVGYLQHYGLALDKQFYKNCEDFDKVVNTPRSNCALDSSYAIRCGAKLTPIADSFKSAIKAYIEQPIK